MQDLAYVAETSSLCLSSVRYHRGTSRELWAQRDRAGRSP